MDPQFLRTKPLSIEELKMIVNIAKPYFENRNRVGLERPRLLYSESNRRPRRLRSSL